MVFKLIIIFAFCVTNLAGQCVDLFRRSPQQLQECKDTVCILYQEENPDVVLDPKMRTSDSSLRPSLCKNRFDEYPLLRGTSFDLLDKIPALHNSY